MRSIGSEKKGVRDKGNNKKGKRQEEKGKRIGMQTEESEWCLSVDGLTVAKQTA